MIGQDDACNRRPPVPLSMYTGYKQAEKDEFFDTIQQRYQRKKEIAERYLVAQMGLSAFVWDPKIEDWEAYTWNMHLFPSIQVSQQPSPPHNVCVPPGGLSLYFYTPFPPYNTHTSHTQADRIFSCDSSSLSFLRSHSLDFNKWIDGVPFLTIEQEATMRKRIEDQVSIGQEQERTG